MSKGKPKGGVPGSSSMKRHARSGRAPKSPKLRLAEKMEAERNEVKRRDNPTMTESVSDLFKGDK